MLVRIILFIFLFALSLSALANNIPFKNFSIDNPLAYRAVSTIVQDKHGFLWFGSSEGIYRYDGYQFNRFYHKPDLDNSLSSNVISQMLVDKKGRLWVATRGGGLSLLLDTSETFLTFNQGNTQAPINNDFINKIAQDNEGKLWIGTEDGLSILSEDGGQWKTQSIHFERVNSSLRGKVIESILVLNDSAVWVGTNGGGIDIFDISGKSVKTLSFQALDKAIVTDMFQDSDGIVWIGTSDSGVFKYSPYTQQVSRFSININNAPANDLSIEDIFQDRSGRIWVASDKGVTLIDLTTEQQHHHTHSVSNYHSLSNDFALTFYQDNKGIVWVGTFSGVSRWDPNLTMFKQYGDYGFPEIANSLVMKMVQWDQHSVLFNTYEGKIYQYNQLADSINEFLPELNLSKYRLTAMFLHENMLFVGTRASGLLEIDLQTKTTKRYVNNANDSGSISANGITDIIADRSGTVWVATFHGGLNRRLAPGAFERFQASSELSDQSPSTNHLLQLMIDHDGFLWLATYGGGINRMDINSRTFVHIMHNKADNSSISSDFSWALLQDNKANLWVGTQGAGLNLLKAEDLINEDFNFTRYSQSDGLKDLTIYALNQDEMGNLWFSSNKGISKLLIKENEFSHFDTRHGLVTMEYNHGATLKALNDEMFFGSAKGLTSVNPRDFVKLNDTPEVKLVGINKLNEKVAPAAAILGMHRVEFSYTDQLVSFEYVGLNFSEPNSTNYQYRLLGFDEQWVDAGKLRRATYTNLPHGEYVFQVKASNADGQWSDPGISLDVIVTPAPWNTWWAFLAYSMFLALALLLYSRQVNSKLVAERNLQLSLKQQVEEKTKRYIEKNQELELANKQLEKLSIIDNATGLRSRRYLDIYIEQAVSLMHQMHQNIAPSERASLPRLFLMLIKVPKIDSFNTTQLINLIDLLKYSSNPDDLIVRWSEDSFAVIGYEKDNAAKYLAVKLQDRFKQVLIGKGDTKIVYSFYPFSIEQPLEYSWEQVSSFIEHVLTLTASDDDFDLAAINGLQDLHAAYVQIAASTSIEQMKEFVKIEVTSSGD